jgi:hypothetical protein
MSLGPAGCAIVAGLVGMLRRASSAVKSATAPIASAAPNIHAPRPDTIRETNGFVVRAETPAASGSCGSRIIC